MASVVSSLRKEVAEGGKVQNVDVGLVSDVGAELTRATVDRIRKPTVEIAPGKHLTYPNTIAFVEREPGGPKETDRLWWARSYLPGIGSSGPVPVWRASTADETGRHANGNMGATRGGRLTDFVEMSIHVFVLRWARLEMVAAATATAAREERPTGREQQVAAPLLVLQREGADSNGDPATRGKSGWQ
ncbi:hypothetical protein B296_00001322 [Ensete ventricosum]|uniref:Uncharacterized protein n=1 Tax=Ensete ventricosum TaxID=4639 RepID=A0A427B5G2_ENSVE|nr:hypothetical protein B296_00001322 [Ensete ventricosum]